MTITVGQTLPDATFKTMGANAVPMATITSSSIVLGYRAVPGGASVVTT